MNESGVDKVMQTNFGTLRYRMISGDGTNYNPLKMVYEHGMCEGVGCLVRGSGDHCRCDAKPPHAMALVVLEVEPGGREM